MKFNFNTESLSVEKILWYILTCIVSFSILVIIDNFVNTPQPRSSFQTDSEYTRCLSLVLAHGDISNAETMCGPLKIKQNK